MFLVDCVEYFLCHGQKTTSMETGTPGDSELWSKCLSFVLQEPLTRVHHTHHPCPSAQGSDHGQVLRWSLDPPQGPASLACHQATLLCTPLFQIHPTPLELEPVHRQCPHPVNCHSGPGPLLFPPSSPTANYMFCFCRHPCHAQCQGWRAATCAHLWSASWDLSS